MTPTNTTAVAIPEALSGKFKESFAYKTLANRLPVIITKVIDFICRHRKHLPKLLTKNESDYLSAEEETKSLIEELARLKYELQTNKQIKEITADLSDKKFWNDHLQSEESRLSTEEVTWFNISWLYAECYFYRRMREVFFLSQHFKQFDQFYSIKEESFFNSVSFAATLASHLLTVGDLVQKRPICDLFYFYTMTSLWGNQCDLSISCGEQNNSINNDFAALESKILVNNFNQLWNYILELSAGNPSRDYRIDIVADNAAYELFTDLCFVEFLHLSNLFPKGRGTVYFHVKKMPWFVSDTMLKDVNWLLDTIEKDATIPGSLKEINSNFKQNFSTGTWAVVEHDFWTLPHDFSQMSQLAPDLYEQFCGSDFILFKGDLNYRKLVGDLNWPFEVTFKDSLRQFQPTSAICSLRTIKADVVVGVEGQKKMEEIQTYPPEWMETGEYAVVHFLNNRTK